MQYYHVLPTLIDLAGEPQNDSDFDCSSFAPVLREESETHRKFAYGMHNNMPEGPPTDPICD